MRRGEEEGEGGGGRGSEENREEEEEGGEEEGAREMVRERARGERRHGIEILEMAAFWVSFLLLSFINFV